MEKGFSDTTKSVIRYVDPLKVIARFIFLIQDRSFASQLGWENRNIEIEYVIQNGSDDELLLIHSNYSSS